MISIEPFISFLCQLKIDYTSCLIGTSIYQTDSFVTSIIDRVSYFSYFTKKSYHANIVILVTFRHSVTILDTSLTTPENLNNDLLILKLARYSYFPPFGARSI